MRFCHVCGRVIIVISILKTVSSRSVRIQDSSPSISRQREFPGNCKQMRLSSAAVSQSNFNPLVHHMSGLSSVLIALFSSATKHRFLSGVPVEDELSGSHGICFYLQLLLHTGLEPCHISRLGEHTVSQCPPKLQMACLCAAALIGTLYLFFSFL